LQRFNYVKRGFTQRTFISKKSDHDQIYISKTALKSSIIHVISQTNNLSKFQMSTTSISTKPQYPSIKTVAWAKLATLAFTLVIGHTCARADASNDKGLITIILENDVLGENKEDRNYSNGLKITWISTQRTTPEWARRWATMGDRLAGVDNELKDVRIEYELGQSMFTPKDMERAVPDPSDRPYAGLLYGSVGIIGKRADDSFEQLQLVLGVVGPSSRAKQVQRGFHKLISGTDPKGWDTQTRDRIAAEIRFQRTERAGRSQIASKLTAEIAPHYGLALGNLNTSVNAGFGVRIGQNLPDDFGPPRISPSLPGSGYFKPTAPYGWYLFGGLATRYVYRNLVLDAPSSTGAGVSRTPWVVDGQYGIAYYRGNVRIAYTQVTRSREFKQQDTKLSSFGALSLTWSH
jgi:lipid A 3-O-deacylase